MCSNGTDGVCGVYPEWHEKAGYVIPQNQKISIQLALPSDTPDKVISGLNGINFNASAKSIASKPSDAMTGPKNPFAWWFIDKESLYNTIPDDVKIDEKSFSDWEDIVLGNDPQYLEPGDLEFSNTEYPIQNLAYASSSAGIGNTSAAYIIVWRIDNYTYVSKGNPIMGGKWIVYNLSIKLIPILP